MRSVVAGAACAILVLVASGQAISSEPTPGLKIDLRFRDNAAEVLSFSTGFSVRTEASEEGAFVPFSQLTFSSRSGIHQYVLGKALNAAQEDTGKQSHNWFWWGLGGLAVIGVAAAGAGNHGNDDSGDTTVCGDGNAVLGDSCVQPQ